METRKSKKITVLGGKEIHVYELRVKEIRAIGSMIEEMQQGITLSSILNAACEMLTQITSAGNKEIDDLSITDLWEIQQAFLEVNENFLKISTSLGIDLSKFQTQVQQVTG